MRFQPPARTAPAFRRPLTRQGQALLPQHIPPPRPPTVDITPTHQSGSGTQVRGTLRLIQEWLLAHTRAQ